MPEFSSNKTVRSRLLTQKLHAKGKSVLTQSNGSSSQNGTYDSKLDVSGTQFTVSEGHPWPPPKGTLADIGGDFSTVKQTVSPIGIHRYALTIPNIPFAGWRQYHEYMGPVLPISPIDPATGKPRFPPKAQSSNSSLNAKGTTAISQCKPTNSVADASVFLGEIVKDGIPKLIGHTLWKDKTRAAQKAGNEYLNIQFGWRPLLNDMSKIAHTIRHANAVLEQYERDAGKVVRRRRNFPVETTYETTNLGSSSPWTMNGGGNIVGGTGTLKRYRETVRRQWFSGAFTYYLPSGYDSRNEMDRIGLLAERIGLTLSPDTVWNLAPWSWAVDWFSNAGDVLNNISSFINDGLLMRYGYLMEETIVTDIYTMEGAKDKLGKSLPVQSLTFRTHTKVRHGASPYGFGITWDGLSTFQASILAALGITRGRR